MSDRNRVEVTARLRGARKFQADAKVVSHSVDDIGDSARRADERIMGLNARATLLRNALGLARPAALVTGLGLAAQGAVALTGAAIGLGAALAPLSGLMVAYPALGLAAAQGLGAFAFAMSGVMGAVGGLNSGLDPKKFGKLSQEAQGFALVLDSMKGDVRGLQSATQAGLFPGLTDALKIAGPTLHTFQSEMKATGTALGDVAQRAALFTRAAGPDLQTIMGRNALYTRRLGFAGVELASAFRHVLIAAGPLLGWLTKGALHLAQLADNSAKAGRESGKLASFFWKTRTVATQLWHIIRNVGLALFHTGDAASSLGGDMLTSLEKASAAWASWAGSTRGKGDMRAYFAELKPTIWEIGRLARDVVKAFVSLGADQNLAPLIKSVRTDLLPLLTTLTASTTSSFGPVMVDALVNVGQLLSALSGGMGPLTLFIAAIGQMAKGLAWASRTIPGMKELVVVLGTIGLASKLIPFAAWASGFTKVKRGVIALKGAYDALKLGMGAMRAVYIANTGVTNASNLAVLRSVAASKIATAATKAQAFAQGALNLVMRANPIILVVTALAALAFGFVMAYRKVKWFHDAVNSVWSFIKNHWPLLVGIILPIAAPIMLIVRHFRTLKSIVSGAASAVKNGLGGAFDWLKGKIDAVLGPLRKAVDLAGKIPGVGLAKKGLGLIGGAAHHIPGLASGGVVRTPGATLVGENGPELLSLERGSRVDPLPRLARGLAERRNATSAAAPAALGGALADVESRAVEVTIPVHLDGRVIYEAVGRVARDRASRR